MKFSESDKYYIGIDELPAKNWFKCQDGDLKYCRKDITQGDEKADEVVWEMLNYDYLDRFGLSRNHKRYLQLRKRLLVLKLDLIITEDRFLENEIEEIEDELKTIFQSDSKNTKNSFEKMLIQMSDYVKYAIDKNISTLEFFIRLEEYGKKN